MAYKVNLSDRALYDINQTVIYLLRNWSVKETKAFLDKLEQLKQIISADPSVFQYHDEMNFIRKAVLTKHNMIYYQVNEKDKIVNVITIFNVFQNPERLDL